MSDVVPVCFRHTDRETYVHCVRCDRPICPDCMLEAPVGFQCVECVKEGARSVRAISAPFETKKPGGARQPGALSQALRGNVTKALVGLNVLAFLLQGGLTSGIAGGRQSSTFTADFAMYPGAKGFGGVNDGEYYRLVTAAFLHSGLLHIAFNMFALWQLGRILERLLGTWRFLGLYMAGAIGGNVLTYLFQANKPVFEQHVSLGASTAVFGLFAAFYLVVKRTGGDTSQLVSLIVINLVITFAVPNIDITGHIGGLLAGAVVGLILTKVSTQKPQLQAGLLAGFIGALLLLAVGVSATI